MKKIFILKGKSETGKTTKINQIVDWIISNYGCSNTVGFDSTNLLKDTHGVLKIKKLSIGINSSGDTEWEVKKIDNLKVESSELINSPDIIICSCRTKGKGRKHLIDNYNYSKGWLRVFINVEEFNKLDLKNQKARDTRILKEIKTWLTGLEKL
ncbi:hypothetical protein [Zunongwangia sp. HGR-M22]|uniref:hypothetical protein n=1 Tax=Zunongwangia sp. HGR-M22 TaxID=3015168 RepID=UPI0022DD294F|nr:hypothetical protein [Zunongwangia sp. HGR-M22]WBL26761.1 hypothetical protein PBT91_05735 [Zunongwangia sp. HGR-M22]